MLAEKTATARVPYTRAGGAQAPYAGEAYYDLPAVKPSHYGWLIVSYFYVGGLASACQFIATVVDLFGHRGDRSTVRAGRYLALAGALVSPPLLIADLRAPERWYNMLRIYRRTSAMSVGSWALSIFGACSGLVAAGQAAEDVFGWSGGRWLARLFSLPAALAGGIVSLYTGTLLAATNLPLWSEAFPFLSSLFASSAASTASAALTLAAEVSHAPEPSRRRLSWFATIAGAAELCFALLINRNWGRHGAGQVLTDSPLSTGWRAGVLGAGIAGPLAVHAVEAITGRRSRPLALLAGLAVLIGGYVLRLVFVFGGNASGRRPQDYFRATQP
jgi:protein NrfD